MNLEETKSVSEALNDSKHPNEETTIKPIAVKATEEESSANEQAVSMAHSDPTLSFNVSSAAHAVGLTEENAKRNHY